MIFGLIQSGSVQQHQMAGGFGGKATTKSVCERIREFFKKVKIDEALNAKAMVATANVIGPFTLAIDRTNWKFGKLNINLLVLALVIRKNMAIPLFWKALPKQGNSNGGERIDVIERFIKVFGATMISSIIGDREFIGKAWIDFLIAHNIPFFIRIKENRLVEWGLTHKQMREFFDHLTVGKRRYMQQVIDGHRLHIAGTRSVTGELVIVISNQDKDTKILDIYRKRWTIELMFRHCKTNGFNLEDTHLKHVDRVEKLLAVVSHALLLCFKMGEVEEKHKKTPYKKTVKAPLWSTFRRGFDWLRRLLNQARRKACTIIISFLPEPIKKAPSCPA